VQAAAASREVEPGLIGDQLVVRDWFCLANLWRVRKQKVQDQRDDLGRHGVEAARVGVCVGVGVVCHDCVVVG